VSEAEMDEDKVREEHMKAVNVPAHWIYLATVLLGGFLLMVLLIALIGGGGG
jgi:hypothetical protein